MQPLALIKMPAKGSAMYAAQNLAEAIDRFVEAKARELIASSRGGFYGGSSVLEKMQIADAIQGLIREVSEEAKRK
jgi:hypothetical protein